MTDRLLRLYIAGNSATSRRAQHNLRRLQDTIKPEEWQVDVIDVLTSPELAEQASVLATPTLSFEGSSRSRRIVGDLSDTKRVLEFLGIEPKGDKA